MSGDDDSGKSSEDEDISDEIKVTIPKLRSKVLPIGSKRRELYRNFSEYHEQHTNQEPSGMDDEMKKVKVRETVSNDKTKSSSPFSLSFLKRLVPWNSTIWNVQVPSMPFLL